MLAQRDPNYRLAKKEAKAIEDTKLENAFKRNEAIKNIFHWTVCIAVILLGACFTFGVSFLAWHFLMPESLHWLPQERLDKIQTWIGIFITGNFFSSYLNKSINN